MALLNMNENEKREWIEDLKESRAKILGATGVDILRQEVALLQAILGPMKNKTSGEIKQTLYRTLEEIAGFWMHDKTRSDVARWVQTLICELGQN